MDIYETIREEQLWHTLWGVYRQQGIPCIVTARNEGATQKQTMNQTRAVCAGMCGCSRPVPLVWWERKEESVFNCVLGQRFGKQHHS